MSIFLGNLSIQDIEKRVGVKFPQALVDFMQETRQEKAADVKQGKWHCFGAPFAIVCGDIQTATEIYKHLEPLGDKFKEPLQLLLNQKEDTA